MRISDWSSDVCSSDLDPMQADILDALRRGANEDALSLARAATTANPQDPQAHRALAMALRASGDSDAALVSIDRAIALAPEDAELHFHRAGYLVGGRQLEAAQRSEEHTSELQSLMRISYAVFCLKKKKQQQQTLYKLY